MSKIKSLFAKKKNNKKNTDSSDNKEHIPVTSNDMIQSSQSMINDKDLPSQSHKPNPLPKKKSLEKQDSNPTQSVPQKRQSRPIVPPKRTSFAGNKKLPLPNKVVANTMGGNTMTGNTMMGSQATADRLQQLNRMRAGMKEKDDKYRARSMNMKPDPNKQIKDRSQSKETADDQDRRHSMFPKDKSFTKERSKYDEKHATNNKQQAKHGKNNKVQYRVKNEIFVLYDYYNPVKIIGSGAYAVVCEAIDTRNGQKVAVKKNKGVFDHITDARRILREIKLLMHFDHQDIIDLIDVIVCEPSEIDTFNDVYLVMPKMETNLAKVIRSKQKLTDRHYQFFIYQMLRGLKYMHSANVIHRDLKPENILINGADCNVKITDFGLARGVCKDDNIEKPTEYVVTRWYRSPEVMCSAGHYDEKVDIWSVGCIFAELILRRPIFPGQNYLDQLKIIFEIMGTPKELTWIKTPEAKRWVQKLKPNDGKDVSKLFEKASPRAIDLLTKMLVLDPSQRIAADVALEHDYLSDLHRPKEEIDCPLFDLSFEFEKSIKTKFGVRHMMYDSLISYEKNPRRPNPHRYKMKDNKKSSSTNDKLKSNKKNHNNNNNNSNNNTKKKGKVNDTIEDEKQSH